MKEKRSWTYGVERLNPDGGGLKLLQEVGFKFNIQNYGKFSELDYRYRSALFDRKGMKFLFDTTCDSEKKMSFMHEVVYYYSAYNFINTFNLIDLKKSDTESDGTYHKLPYEEAAKVFSCIVDIGSMNPVCLKRNVSQFNEAIETVLKRLIYNRNNFDDLFENGIDEFVDLLYLVAKKKEHNLYETVTFATRLIDDDITTALFKKYDYRKLLDSYFLWIENTVHVFDDDINAITSKGDGLLTEILKVTDETWSNKFSLMLRCFAQFGRPVLSSDKIQDELVSSWAETKSGGKLFLIDVYKSIFNKMSGRDRFNVLWHQRKNGGIKMILNKHKDAVRVDSKLVDLLSLAGIDKRTYERMVRRESEFNPLNSLGISIKTGYEAEHFSEEATQFENDGGFDALNTIGLKKGGGGVGRCGSNAVAYLESSPGPFNDYATAKLFFNAFINSGVMSLDVATIGLHFNVGISKITDENIALSKFATIIKAMQVSGHGFDSKRDPRTPRLKILPQENPGPRIEAKSLSVVTKEGFDWLMDNGVYLSWALNAAVTENGIDNPTSNKYRKLLADIFESFIQDIKEGELSFFDGKKEYSFFSNLDAQSHAAETVYDELRKIFPDVGSYYLNPDDITTSVDGDVKPINALGQTFPNIVSFVRFVVEKHSQIVSEMADKIELEFINEILLIQDVKSTRKRMNMIKNFLKKYNTPGVDFKNKESVVDSFERVREVMLCQTMNDESPKE